MCSNNQYTDTDHRILFFHIHEPLIHGYTIPLFHVLVSSLHEHSYTLDTIISCIVILLYYHCSDTYQYQHYMNTLEHGTQDTVIAHYYCMYLWTYDTDPMLHRYYYYNHISLLHRLTCMHAVIAFIFLLVHVTQIIVTWRSRIPVT